MQVDIVTLVAMLNGVLQRSKSLLFLCKNGRKKVSCIYIQSNLNGSNTFRTIKYLFEIWIIRVIEDILQNQVGRHNRDIFSIFFHIKVHCVF